MARPAGEPLTRISLNLFDRDLAVIRRHYPNGYQLELRELVHKFAVELEADETNQFLEKTYG